MAHTYPHSKFALLVLIGIASLTGNGQSIAYLNGNNVNAGIRVGGSFFTDTTEIYGRFESPKDSGTMAIFAQALWFTAIDPQGDLHCAAQRYEDFGNDFFDGPIVTTYDNNYDSYYKRVFKVTKIQIDQFKALSFPVAAGQVDAAILNWPGKGSTWALSNYGVSIINPLAPFKDLNGNGIYEPLQGEYPLICGDQGIFFVYNDARNVHTQTNGQALGIEVRGIASAFNDSTSAGPYAKHVINNTVFVQYEVENKSTVNYTGFDVANWLDPDLGCFQNDRIGCDTLRNLMFVYNGNTTDPDCAPEKGYGALPVSLGIKFLNQPMNTYSYFTNGSPPNGSDPITPVQYRNYQEGYWGDTTAITFGGNGYSHGTGIPTNFVFPGDPNIASEWSEVNPQDQSSVTEGDRRIVGNSKAGNFNAGEVKHFDFALFTTFDRTSNNLAIIDTLKNDADLVQDFYNNQIRSCQTQLALGTEDIATGTFNASIYPNPANKQVTIESPVNMQALQLTDMAGRVLLTRNTDATKITLPLNNLAKGIYLVNIQSAGMAVIKKLVVQ